ncbi:MAG: MarR family transcriptional regulator [Sphingopyxis sp.]|nr:MarR family transcriptional regulator [Sphingopyxis sp.]
MMERSASEQAAAAWAQSAGKLSTDGAGDEVAPSAVRIAIISDRPADALPPALMRALDTLDIVASAHPLAAIADHALPAGAALLWVDFSGQPDGATVSALADYAATVHQPMVIDSGIDAIDTVWAALADTPRVTITCDADHEAAVAAIAQLLAPQASAVNSPTAPARGEQIAQLQDEVQRISRLLARLAMDGGDRRLGDPFDRRDTVPSPFIETGVRADTRGYHSQHEETATPPVSARTVRQLIRRRRMREEFFGPDLFADPAWDMMLDLYAARLEYHRVSVSSLCIAAAVPATTALRWIKTLTEAGLFTRESDQHDGRRIFVALTDKATTALHRYFARTLEE